MAMVSLDHIDVDEKGVARISGTRTKVIQIVMEKMVNGWSPEEMQKQFPHLSLADVYAALAYYYDHQPELDARIEQDFQEAERMRAEAGPSAIADKLRALGKLP